MSNGPVSQDEIAELLQSGTRQVWVVRLIGPRRVEVYRPGESMRLAGPGEVLTAQGLLRNPVPIEALYDRDSECFGRAGSDNCRSWRGLR